MTAITKAQKRGQETTRNNLEQLVSREERSVTYSRAQGSERSGIISGDCRYAITQLSNYKCLSSGEGMPYEMTDGKESQSEMQAHGIETRGRKGPVNESVKYYVKGMASNVARVGRSGHPHTVLVERTLPPTF